MQCAVAVCCFSVLLQCVVAVYCCSVLLQCAVAVCCCNVLLQCVVAVCCCSVLLQCRSDEAGLASLHAANHAHFILHLVVVVGRRPREDELHLGAGLA